MQTKTILITGGAGFIGSHVVRLFVNKYPEYKIINYDALTYAGNLENLKDIENKPNYHFIKGDICDKELINNVIRFHQVTGVIHLAAESHVDRSILNPSEFANTNIMGTLTLLQVCKDFWQERNYEDCLFYHISTDEVYGALDMNPDNKFKETNKYQPHSPYSASKASSDHFVRAFHDTYGMPTVISNCSNNYGPNQFPEKLIPLVINNIRNKKPIPVYGTGENIRDWLYVEDHAKAIDCIFHKGKVGETYNIGGNNEKSNIDIVKKIIDIVTNYNWKDKSWFLININYDHFIKYVEDRKGHDLRYAIDSSKLQDELGWKPEETFETGILKTVKWYLDNKEWLKNITSGKYQDYYKEMYG